MIRMMIYSQRIYSKIYDKDKREQVKVIMPE